MIKINSVLLLILLLFSFEKMNAQIEGCTDPNANNYNPAASINNGSCTYDPTYFLPPVKFILSSEVNENSGLVFFNGGIWTINDSGGDPVLYKIDTISGAIVQRITIANAQNIDWEDITQDEDYVYVGDFGNNPGNRDDLRIYKLLKSGIPQNGDASLTAEIIDFYYEDQTSFRISNRSHNFDCESVISYGDKLYLFSKNWGDQKCKLYELPKQAGNYEAVKINEFNTKGLITGASINLLNNQIILVGYENKIWMPFIWILWDFQSGDIFSGNKRRIDFPQIITSQTEGVEFVNDQRVFISAENTSTFSQRVYEVNTALWTSNFINKIIELDYSDKYSLKIVPNPVKGKRFVIEIKIPENESFNLEIYDQQGRKVDSIKSKFVKSREFIKVKMRRKGLKKGLYLVKLKTSKYAVVEKLIIN